jgi:predicted acylesterase/phospholipase RssA
MDLDGWISSRSSGVSKNSSKTEQSVMQMLRSIGVTSICAVLCACVTAPQRNALPESLADEAMVFGTSAVRLWGDAIPADWGERLQLIIDQKQTRADNAISGRPINFLSISGGGANGAFGAGFLKGWTESGDRPEMLAVTGISTGALIAPFAFLGSEYDDELEHLYTELKTADVIKKKRLVSGLFSDGLVDTEPFKKLLRDHVDADMIRRIANEYDRGRRLLIGTTNLDAQRPVIWNIGALAKLGTLEANQLIRDVMLASASIPGAFPPVRIEVQVGDEVYDELHVDGGVSTQVFLYPAGVALDKVAEQVGADLDLSLFIIRNGYLEARWSEVKPSLLRILLASTSTMIRTQGLGDLYRIYVRSVQQNVKFRLAYIPDDFSADKKEQFDPEYMRAVFDMAYDLAKNGYDWAESPPGMSASE